MTLSIAICTFNRLELLRVCLKSLVHQKLENVEIFVVDNGTITCSDLVLEYEGVRYIREDNTGLSHARNRAIKEAKGDWILFLDDDAKVKSDFVFQALNACSKNYLIFGGVYFPWYYYGKPIWYREEYGSNKNDFSNPGLLQNREYLSGGIMAIHKSVIDKIGNFKTNLGMKGNSLGYSEETELQKRAIEKGIKRYYIPELVIFHVVAQYKLDVNWHLKSYFQLGKAMATYSDEKHYALFIRNTVIGIGLFIYSVLLKTPLLIQKTYYIENWKMDVLRKAYKRLGLLYQIISKN